MLISKDNRIISIEDSAAPILDDEGKIIGVVMVFHDATEQRNVEKVQLESAEKLRFLAESMPQKITHFESKWGSWIISIGNGRTLPARKCRVQYHGIGPPLFIQTT